jgi:hypothetical protein
MTRTAAALAAPVIALMLAACALPRTQLGTISPDALYAEQLKQQQLAIEWDLKQQQRVEDIGHALLAAATPFCNGALTPKSGLRFANVYSYARDYQAAARAMGFSDTLVVVGVAAGSAAERAGFAVGDRVVAMDGGAPPVGPTGLQTLARQLQTRRVPGTSLTLQRGTLGFSSSETPGGDTTTAGPAQSSATLRTAVPSDTVCGYNLLAARKDELNAWADGTNVTVTSAMLRFVADDDELAAVLAHEIAHNAMRHIQAQQKNAALGGLFGAIIDIAAATQGVNTQGEFTKHGMNVGSMVFSQDFEREADYVGMYLLARAGRSTTRAPNLWRRMAQENPGSIKYASTHPTTAERFVRLEQASREIEQKIARGEELTPEMRGAPVPAGRPSSRALASSTRSATPASTKPVPTPAAATPRASAPPPRSAPTGKSEPVKAALPQQESAGTVASSARGAVSSYTTLEVSDSVTYTFGPAAPRNGLTAALAKRRAARVYQDGLEAIELRLYAEAEVKYREAVLYDGGEAKYHAALGALLLKRGKIAAAEAALSAAVLLDMENAEYRKLLTEARARP